ncbi:MAG TPA: transcription termination/antitermination NusG family protein [Pyrinomonadaceae bacterium]|jgi:transcriptional antiterminator RfaH
MSLAISDEQPHWYAVRTKPKEEDRADFNLQAYRVKTFAPKLKQLSTSKHGGRRYTIKHLFPPYIFAYFNAETQLHNVNYTRGVQHVVSFANNPVWISDDVIDLIKSKVGDDGLVCLHEELKPGDEVRITSGPLQSLVGVFKRHMSDKERVEILLNTINYQSHLLIDREMVEKIH